MQPDLFQVEHKTYSWQSETHSTISALVPNPMTGDGSNLVMLPYLQIPASQLHSFAP